MPNLSYVDHQKILLKSHPDFNEVWVHDRIAEKPSIIGLGELILRDRERPQPRAGRLDMLLQDNDSDRRYEVEIQLGSSDESHIIRTIEYWDIERKRYPQYDHCAVLIAEDITSRFLNVVSLLNRSIPLIAIQMSAIKIDTAISLIFTKVLDEYAQSIGLEEDEEKVVTDRSYWITNSSEKNIQVVDKLFEEVQKLDENLGIKYNKFYIGLTRNGIANNFVTFKPRKGFIRVRLHMPKTTEVDEKLNNSSLDDFDYDSRLRAYRVKLSYSDVDQHIDSLTEFMKIAYEIRNT